MGFSVAIVLIALSVILFALKGVFGIFPDNWEWVGIVLGGGGLAMAIPSIFQMLWGRPILKVVFENGVEESKRFLPVYLSNPPIKNRFLRTLGVRRETIQSITAQFRISELGSGKIVINSRQARIYSDDDPDDKGRFRTILPPTYSIAGCIMVASWVDKSREVVIPPDRLRKQLESIPEGTYLVQILFMVEGEKQEESRQFIVGKTQTTSLGFQLSDKVCISQVLRLNKF